MIDSIMYLIQLRRYRMGQTVYVDLLFLINFSMDFLCFFITAKILSRKLPLIRAILGSALGGVYGVMALFPGYGTATALAVDALVCILMCLVVFAAKGRMRDIPLFALVYIAVSMALGGFMTALFNLLNKTDIPLEASDVQSDGISVWVFALLAIICAAITLFGGKFFKRKAEQTSAEIEIAYNGKKLKLRGLVDSGNLLREPISGKPCVVADISKLEKIMPQEILRAARKKDPRAVETFKIENARNIRLIPTRTAAGDGMLIGVRVESVTVSDKKGNKNLDVIIVPAELGNTADGNEALLPSGILV